LLALSNYPLTTNRSSFIPFYYLLFAFCFLFQRPQIKSHIALPFSCHCDPDFVEREAISTNSKLNTKTLNTNRLPLATAKPFGEAGSSVFFQLSPAQLSTLNSLAKRYSASRVPLSYGANLRAFDQKNSF
jgi:hypothetical protein